MIMNFMYTAVLVMAVSMLVSSIPLSQQPTRVVVNQLSKQLAKAELEESPRVHMSKVAPAQIMVREGESVTLECSAVGVPAPVIYWKKDGKRIRQAQGDHEANLLEKVTNIGSSTVESSSTLGRLQLDCVQPSMAGVYECVADNGFNKIVNRTRVEVAGRDASAASDYLGGINNCLSINGQAEDSASIAVAPRIFLFTEWRFEKQGNNVQLFCRASGYPKPRITWLNENLEAIQNGEDITVLSNGDLFLRNVNTMGQYFCVASNAVGQTKMDTFLYVTKPDDEEDVS